MKESVGVVMKFGVRFVVISMMILLGSLAPERSQAQGVLSFSTSCNGFSFGVLSLCFSYSWTAVCNNGTAVGGTQEYTEQCAGAAVSACAGNGGLATVTSCDPGYQLKDGLCIKQVLVHVANGRVTRQAEKVVDGTARPEVCLSYGRWACDGKCVKLDSACKGSCFDGRELNKEGSCELR